jgi:hypothetical protein
MQYKLLKEAALRELIESNDLVDEADKIYDDWKEQYLLSHSNEEFIAFLQSLLGTSKWYDWETSLAEEKGERFKGWDWDDVADRIHWRVCNDISLAKTGTEAEYPKPNLDGPGSFRAKLTYPDFGTYLGGSFT